MKLQANTDAIKKAIEIVGDMTKFSKRLGVSYQTVLNWKSGRGTPSIQNSIKIEQITDGKVKREEILLDEKKELEIAKNLLAAGVDIDTIAKTTGISVEELGKIHIKNQEQLT